MKKTLIITNDLSSYTQKRKELNLNVYSNSAWITTARELQNLNINRPEIYVLNNATKLKNFSKIYTELQKMMHYSKLKVHWEKII